MKYRSLTICTFFLSLCQSILVHSADCPNTQTQLSDGTCVPLNDVPSSSSGAAALVGVAGLGYLVYKMTSAGDSPEESKLRTQEISNGYGLRLNNINAPIRVSTFRSPLSNPISNLKNANGISRKEDVSLISVDYVW
jgi:hypothetical protein